MQVHVYALKLTPEFHLEFHQYFEHSNTNVAVFPVPDCA